MTAEPHEPVAARNYWSLTIAATLTMSVSYFDRHTLAVISPKVTEDLGINEKRFGFIVSAFSLAYLVGAPIAGRLVDRYGARRVLVAAVLAWTVVAATQSFATSFLVLLFMRVALGFAEAPSFPGAAQTVTRALLPLDRPRGFGLLFTGSSIGALVASLAAPALTRHYGWRYAFLLTAIAGLVWIPMWLSLTGNWQARAVLDHAQRAGSVMPVETAVDEPIRFPVVERASFWDTLSNPGVVRAVVLVVMSAPLANFVLNWSARLLKKDFGITEDTIGQYAWIPPILFDVGSLAFGYLASRATESRHPARNARLLFLAAGMAAASLPGFYLFGGPWAASIFAGISIGGVGGLFAMLTADMLARVSPSSVSTAGGITAAAQSLAYIIANPLIGWVVDDTHSYVGPIIALSVLVVPGLATWLLWSPRPRAVA